MHVHIQNVGIKRLGICHKKCEYWIRGVLKWGAWGSVGVGTRKHQRIRIGGFWCLIRVFPGDLSIVQGFCEV